jgi:hypothetical protein
MLWAGEMQVGSKVPLNSIRSLVRSGYRKPDQQPHAQHVRLDHDWCPRLHLNAHLQVPINHYSI